MCEGVSSVTASAHTLVRKVILGCRSNTVTLCFQWNNRRSQDFTLPSCPHCVPFPISIDTGISLQTAGSPALKAAALGRIFILKQWTTVLCRWWLSLQPLTLTRDLAPMAWGKESSYFSPGGTICTTSSKVSSPLLTYATARAQQWWWGEMDDSLTKQLLRSLCRWQLPMGSVSPCVCIYLPWVCICLCILVSVWGLSTWPLCADHLTYVSVTSPRHIIITKLWLVLSTSCLISIHLKFLTQCDILN